MREDLQAAFRSLRTSPSFTIAALLVLTLAIGASTALFSVVDAVVLRGLPFDESDRLVAVGEQLPARIRAANGTRDPDALSFVTPQNYLDWSAQQQVFESMAAIASCGSRSTSPAANLNRSSRSTSPSGSSMCCAPGRRSDAPSPRKTKSGDVIASSS